MKFSRKKYDQLTQKNRENKIREFISEIEKCWELENQRQILLSNFKEFLSFFPEKHFLNSSNRISSDMSRRNFLKIAVPLEQNLNIDLRDPELEIKKLDYHKTGKPELDLILVLDNLRPAFNVGSIIRTAECFGIRELYFCGYTPDNERVAKTAMGTRELINVRRVADTKDAIRSLSEQKRTVYALETVTNAMSIYKCEYQYPAVLIVGNEALGISREILQLADAIIEIPLSGWKNSLNVGIAAAITIAEMVRRKDI